MNKAQEFLSLVERKVYLGGKEIKIGSKVRFKIPVKSQSVKKGDIGKVTYLDDVITVKFGKNEFNISWSGGQFNKLASDVIEVV